MNALYDAYYTSSIISTFCDAGYKAVATDDSISVQRCLMLHSIVICFHHYIFGAQLKEIYR